MNDRESLRDDADLIVEVRQETYRDLEAIARLLDCNVEAALDHVISEYVLPHGGNE